MNNSQLKKYFIYTTIPTVAIGILYLNRDKIYSLRQRYWAYRLKSSHTHGHSHNQGKSHSHAPASHDTLKETLFHELPLMLNSNAKDLTGREDGIRILEIGLGTGTNFKYYPTKSKLIAVDPNPYFEESVFENLSKHPGISLEKRLISGAEDMSQISDNHVDVVIATFVFCQVKDVALVFQEILRILVPGGKFYYMDHIGIGHGFMKTILSKVLTYSGLARFIFNANLNRDIGKIMGFVGFNNFEQNYVIHDNHRILLGVAEK